MQILVQDCILVQDLGLTGLQKLQPTARAYACNATGCPILFSVCSLSMQYSKALACSTKSALPSKFSAQKHPLRVRLQKWRLCGAVHSKPGNQCLLNSIHSML